MNQVIHHAVETEPSTRDRLERVVDAGQRMIVTRFDLLSLEIKETISAALRTGVVTTAGALLLLLGHIAGVVAGGIGMAMVMPAWAAALILAGIHFVLGGVAVLVGTTQSHKPKLGISDEEEQTVQRRLPSPATGQSLESQAPRPLLSQPQES
jgi:hypothetical protein